MNNPKIIGITFGDAKPPQPIGRIGRLVDASCDFASDDVAYFVKDSWRYRHVLLDPGCMWNGSDFNRREEVLSEGTTFRLLPGESGTVLAHEVMHQTEFHWPKEIIVDFFKLGRSVSCILASQLKGFWVCVKLRHGSQRVAYNISKDTVSTGQFCDDR